MHWGSGGWKNWYSFENTETYYMSPNEGKDWGYHCFDLLMILQEESNIKEWDLDFDREHDKISKL